MKRDDLMEAEDWKAMYLILCRGISKAIEIGSKIEEKAMVDALVEASLEAEDYYINVTDAISGDDKEKSCLKEEYQRDNQSHSETDK